MTTPSLLMSVLKYIPDRMYGFLLSDSGQEIFFHLRVFHPLSERPYSPKCLSCKSSCLWSETPPPPILGEQAMVDLDENSETPRACRVVRLVEPIPLVGTVDVFDAARGYGFIHGVNGETYHLHRCEVVEGRMPLPGQPVLFYPGKRQGKPRACHVKIC